MKPVERIEKLIKERRYKAGAKTYDKALGSFLQAVDDHLKHKAASTESKIWRKIMKSRITKLATAAVILITAYVVLYQSGGSIDVTTVTFAQITQNMEQMPWLHVVAEQEQAAGTEILDLRYEGWFCFEQKKFAVKESNGAVIFQNDLEHILQVYDPNTETITISRNPQPDWSKGLGSVVDLHKVVVKEFEALGEKVVRETGKYKGKDVLVFKMSAFLNGMDQKIEMTVDAKSPVVLYIHQRAFDKAGKLTQETYLYFEYPETGPESIYNVGVPKSTKTVSDEKEKEETDYDKAFEEAISAIDSRNSWSEPRDLVIAYWQARTAKNYDEMTILWPGSATWIHELENEEPVEYVFGKAKAAEGEDTGLIVPYASKSYFDKHGKYNLKMVLSNKKSNKGRYYIVSGN